MISRFIIPVIITGAAHAALFFAGPKEEAPLPAAPQGVVINVEEFPPLPPVPPTRTEDDRDDKPAVDIKDIQMPPMLPPVISSSMDRVFVEPFNPTIPPARFGDRDTRMIPVGDYREAGKRIRDSGPLFKLSDLDNRPRALFQAAPEYPHAQKNTGATGEVIVNFTVDERGYVQDVHVVKSTHPDFETPTIRAVSKWRFEPGRKNGQRVKFRMSVPVAFDLSDGF